MGQEKNIRNAIIPIKGLTSFNYFVIIFFMKPLLKLLITSLAIIITAYFLPGVRIADFWTAITVAVAMGIVNTIIKPIVLFFTLPLNILTLGLFTFVVNGALIMLITFFIPGFQIEGFFTAVIFSILVMIINWILIKLTV